MQYGAVIVAAGMSTRMGRPKQLMRIEGKTFAERIVSTFRDAGVSDIAVVTGCKADSVENSLRGMNLVFLRNEDYMNSQMFDSARLGLSYMYERCDRVFFCPVDIPLFLTQTVRLQMACEEQVVYPVFDGLCGHPVLIVSSIVPRLLRYEGKGGLKGALESLDGVAVRMLPVADEGVSMDADYYPEYQRLVALQSRRSGRASLSV